MARPGGVISKSKKWPDLVELSQNPKSGQTWWSYQNLKNGQTGWSYLKIQKVARSGRVISKSKKWPDLVELSQSSRSGGVITTFQNVLRTNGAITKLKKMAKQKFRFGHFQELCDNFTSLSDTCYDSCLLSVPRRSHKGLALFMKSAAK